VWREIFDHGINIVLAEWRCHGENALEHELDLEDDGVKKVKPSVYLAQGGHLPPQASDRNGSQHPDLWEAWPASDGVECQNPVYLRGLPILVGLDVWSQWWQFTFQMSLEVLKTTRRSEPSKVMPSSKLMRTKLTKYPRMAWRLKKVQTIPPVSDEEDY
jgi:hypothetical protein